MPFSVGLAKMKERIKAKAFVIHIKLVMLQPSTFVVEGEYKYKSNLKY